MVIGAAPAVAAPILTLAKTPGGGSVIAGGTATLTIVLSNGGTEDSVDTALVDFLPAPTVNFWAVWSGAGSPRQPQRHQRVVSRVIAGAVTWH